MNADRVRTVSEVNHEARMLVEERFRLVWIEGEVSNFRRYASGHWYFSLKDDRAQLSCVMFASRNRFVRTRVRDGLAVVVRGRLSIYTERGAFQAVVDHLEPAGEGALQAAYEELKGRLGREGLFDPARKLPIPAYPRHVAVISSESAAALKDVLAVLGRRFPCVRVTCFFVAVQGYEAEGQILGAFNRAERMRSRPDVIIVTRGGGSLEDLAAFNRESVARRIAAARIPVIAAIGHETDVTIADFAADRRAPTPSAAAELATPDGAELLQRVGRYAAAITNLGNTRLRTEHRLLDAMRNRLVHPGRALEQRMQRADELAERLNRAVRALLDRAQTTVGHRRALLVASSPQQRIDGAREQVERTGARLRAADQSSRATAESRLGGLARALQAVSPSATLDRGYAIVAKPDGSRWGTPVVSAQQAVAGEELLTHLKDGRLRVQVTEANP
ncbi:MAG: exodeoxyribonuclease VII large subunit [Gammaproteobacteria bacterium]|nr:exodeoxyribonuclease VII large subunit [Gammaproteobacteria bacterium]